MWDKKHVNNLVSAESGGGAVIAPIDCAQSPDARRRLLFRICIAQEDSGPEFNSFNCAICHAAPFQSPHPGRGFLLPNGAHVQHHFIPSTGASAE